MAENTKKKTLWNFVNSLEGDKVVWMIIIILFLLSFVAISSSTTLLALTEKRTRMAIIQEQLFMSMLGLGVIIVCYNIKKIGFFRIVSQLGYAVSISLSMLLLLASIFCKGSNWDLGLLQVHKINDAWRIVSIFGQQIHVYEVVKVAMVMYLAWAVNASHNDSFTIANQLARKHQKWREPLVKKIAYIYFPILSICLCLMPGGLSSPLIIGGTMFLTILIGGINIKELVKPIGIGIILLGLCFIVNKISPADHKPFPHLASSQNRIFGEKVDDHLQTMRENPQNSKEFQEALDEAKQQLSSKIAIHEGGLFGKGPGRSTQKYVVPIMFEDYMYSFIVEEYGLLGGLIVLALYISLLARGSIIVRNCDNPFAKTAVAGLTLLITGQALVHIMVNCDFGVHTGQTLPIISHGNASLLMFSLAFGIILSISRMAKRKIDREINDAKALVNREVNRKESNGASDQGAEENVVLNQNEEISGINEGIPEHENDIPDYGIDDHNNE